MASSHFLGQAEDLQPSIARAAIWEQSDHCPILENLELSSPGQLFVTGHSLGAAMAVIAGVKYPFNKIVTFGEPSVGNDLDNSIDPECSHIRYVNGVDPVTKIVPESMYKHHGEPIEIEDMDGPDVRFDHSIINYSAILETW